MLRKRSAATAGPCVRTCQALLAPQGTSNVSSSHSTTLRRGGAVLGHLSWAWNGHTCKLAWPVSHTEPPVPGLANDHGSPPPHPNEKTSAGQERREGKQLQQEWQRRSHAPRTAFGLCGTGCRRRRGQPPERTCRLGGLAAAHHLRGGSSSGGWVSTHPCCGTDGTPASGALPAPPSAAQRAPRALASAG